MQRLPVREANRLNAVGIGEAERTERAARPCLAYLQSRAQTLGRGIGRMAALAWLVRCSGRLFLRLPELVNALSVAMGSGFLCAALDEGLEQQPGAFGQQPKTLPARRRARTPEVEIVLE